MLADSHVADSGIFRMFRARALSPYVFAFGSTLDRVVAL